MKKRIFVLALGSLVATLVWQCSQDFMADIPCSFQTECPKDYKCKDQRCVPCAAGECTNGSYIQQGFEVATNNFDFGYVQVGTTKIDTINIKYVAISGAPINIKGSIESGKEVFKVINESFQELKKGGSLEFQVSYSPKAIRSDSGTLVITSNEPGEFTTKIKLSGRGVDPDILVTPSSINFLDSFKNGGIQKQDVKIENRGSGPLEIKKVALNEGAPVDFTLELVPSGGAVLQPNANLTFKVVFTPKTPGTLTATVSIENSDKDKPRIDISVRAFVSDQCEEGYYDMNKEPSDGCECLGDKRGGSSCDKNLVKPVIQGENLPDTGGCVTVGGNLVPEDAVDWWTFIGVDTPDVQGNSTAGGDKYRIAISFLSNPDKLVFDVYKGCKDNNGRYTEFCAGDECIPKKEDKVRNLEEGFNQKCASLEFDMSKTYSPGGTEHVRGEEICHLPTHTSKDANINHCVDDTARYYIRVYRNKDPTGGIPVSLSSCEKYVLQVCNGK